MGTIWLYGEHLGVDDLVERTCLRQGWEIRRGQDVASDMDRLCAQPPALLLLVAGRTAREEFAALYALRSNPVLASVPIVMIGTPGGPVRELEEAVALGANEFIDSPFHVEEFVSHVSLLLDKQGS